MLCFAGLPFPSSQRSLKKLAVGINGWSEREFEGEWCEVRNSVITSISNGIRGIARLERVSLLDFEEIWCGRMGKRG